jgi:hypothetical protein
VRRPHGDRLLLMVQTKRSVALTVTACVSVSNHSMRNTYEGKSRNYLCFTVEFIFCSLVRMVIVRVILFC